MTIFLAVFFLIFIIIAYYNLRWAIFLILSALPSYLIRFQVLGIPMTALEGMILIIFLIWVLNRFKIKDLRLKNSVSLFLCFSVFLFLASATIGMFVSPNLREAAGIWKAYFIEPILFFIVLIYEFRAKSPPCPPLFKGGVGGFSFIISALSISAFYISIYAILQRFFGFSIPSPWQTELRVTSVFPYPNAVGLFLAPLIPLFIYQLIKSETSPTPSLPLGKGEGKGGGQNSKTGVLNLLVKSYWSIVICLALTAVYLAKTEAALAALAVGLVFFLLLYTNKTRFILILLAFLFFIFYFLFPSNNLFLQIENKILLGDWSGKVRQTMWLETWEMLKDKPIFGAGLSGYQTAILPYHKADWMEVFLYPHNIIFNFWSETGLLGLISFFGIIFWFFYFGFKNLFRDSGFGIGNYKLGYLAILTSMVVLLIHGLVDVLYFKNDLSVLFWTILALPIIIKNDKMD